MQKKCLSEFRLKLEGNDDTTSINHIFDYHKLL